MNTRLIESIPQAKVGAALHQALVQIFGAEPEQVVITNRDHLSITVDVRPLCMLAGGAWAKLVTDLEAKLEERKTYKDPGDDPRLKPEPKP